MTYDPDKLRQMLLGSSGDEEEQEKEEEQKPVETKKPEEPEKSEQKPLERKPTETPGMRSDETPAQAPRGGEADLADRLRRSFETSKSQSIPKEETPKEPMASQPEQDKPPVEEKREPPRRDPDKPESPREALERLRAEQIAKEQQVAKPQEAVEKAESQVEKEKTPADITPTESADARAYDEPVGEQPAIPEADFASFTDASDKPAGRPVETPPQPRKQDESDINERLRRALDGGKSQLPPEKEKAPEPIKEETESIRMPVEEKRELPGDQEKSERSSDYGRSIQTPPEPPKEDEPDLSDRLKPTHEVGKSQLPPEKEKAPEPIKEETESIRMPVEEKRELPGDQEKAESPKEVLERLRAEQAAKAARKQEPPKPETPVESLKEDKTEVPEAKPAITSSADMLREHARQMGFTREDSAIDETPEIPAKEEPKAEVREPAGVTAPAMKNEPAKEQEQPSQPTPPTASHQPEPRPESKPELKSEMPTPEPKSEKPEEPVKPPEIPEEPRKSSESNFGSLRQVLADREREVELEPKTPEGEKAGREAKLSDEEDEERTAKKSRAHPPKKITVHPPGPLSWLAFMGGAISIIGATVALAIGQTGTPVIGLGSIGVVLVGSFAIVNRYWMKVFVSSRSTRYSANIAMVILSLLGILVFVNIMAYRYHYRIDMSSEKLHSLSQQTLTILNDINRAGETIEVTAFVPQNSSYRDNVEKLMDMYLYKSSHLHFTFVDPDVKLELAESKGITRTPSVLFELGEHKSIVTDIDEPHFTSALTAVRQTESRLVSFLAGHGEPDPFAPENDQSGLSKFREQLELEGYEVDTLRIPSANGVPPETSLLIIAGPTRDLQPPEISAIDRYLEQGGNMMVMLEPGKDAGLAGILAKYGISPVNATVLDDQNNAYGELNNPIVVGNPEHAITESLVEGMVFSNAEALNFTTSQRLPGVTTESLARSASTSWVDKNENRTFDEGVETREASEVAVLSTLNPDGASSEVEEEPASEAEETEGSERETEAEETEGESASDEVEPVEPAQTALPEGTELSQVLVVGDVSFIRNASYDNYYNKDFALNAVNFLTARHDLISIRPNKPEDRPLNLQNWQRSVIFAFSVILTPLLIAGLGGLVWWKRS